jgi:4-hydroxythreonine-4-phosphate dehydrogenase
MKQNIKRIIITSGDPSGIGLEVIRKALYSLGPQKGVQFILFTPKMESVKTYSQVSKKILSHEINKTYSLIDQKFTRVLVENLEEIVDISPLSKVLIEINTSLNPAEWVELSAKACISKKVDGMVTAPISKTLIKKAGFKDIGHTDILKRISKTKNVYMTFLGQEFNVCLLTGHLPIQKISSSIKASDLKSCVELIDQLNKKLKNHKPIGLVGLNPHSGESGLIGMEEQNILIPLLKKLTKTYSVLGPLVPDAAFFKENWNKYSIFLSLYHDQGLIPFKMIHGQSSGAQLSLGLPFVRTSVDHGTAENIFGKNKANANSMVDALKWCIKLIK